MELYEHYYLLNDYIQHDEYDPQLVDCDLVAAENVVEDVNFINDCNQDHVYAIIFVLIFEIDVKQAEDERERSDPVVL